MVGEVGVVGWEWTRWAGLVGGEPLEGSEGGLVRERRYGWYWFVSGAWSWVQSLRLFGEVAILSWLSRRGLFSSGSDNNLPYRAHVNCKRGVWNPQVVYHKVIKHNKCQVQRDHQHRGYLKSIIFHKAAQEPTAYHNLSVHYIVRSPTTPRFYKSSQGTFGLERYCTVQLD